MPSHAEIELKWALSHQAHDALEGRLLSLLGSGRLLKQTNRFFDTPNLALRATGQNLRLRLEDQNGAQRLLLTCKRRLPDKEGAHHHEEWEEWLEQAWWQRLAHEDPGLLLPLPPHIRDAIGDERLHSLGGFSNHRIEWDHDSELICLDRTDFTLRADCELEIETADPGRSSREWGERLASWGIIWQEQPLSKFARYVQLTAKAQAGGQSTR